mmetsp:Transcript_104246/g.290386  ORF Transcript_104246/g.290386 Transcript_104246/m.290386 type:complete len:846 (-) Transcript_104246:100-2637(-)
MAESVVVGVRVRPFNEREKALNAEICVDMDGPTTTIRNLKLTDGSPTSFTFDESFWSHDGFEDDGTGYYKAKPNSKYADQAYVFNTFGTRVLNNAWEGFHCCLFAYGQTGSGKSYSMVGYGPNKGIVPISCEEIFRRIEKNTNPNLHYEVVVSAVEIYNEIVQDLLVPPEERPKKGLDIRESKLLGIYIDGVRKRPVDSYPAIEKTIDEATENRTVGSTLMNSTSSRAHTVLTIEFKQVEKVAGDDASKLSMINLVDLAGSEKAGQTGATGDRLKEGAAINKSLSALGNVIERLAQRSGGKKNVIIPYRESKLTRLLQNALGGSSKTIMICALSPASSNYEETLSTLRYADRAKRIKNMAVVNENPQEKLMRELREENNKLKEFMESVKDTLGEKDAAALNERVKEIKAAEDVLREQQKSFQERLKESVQQQRDSARRGTRGRSIFAVSTDEPHITNLNEDMLLTGRIKHFFPEGKTTRIGQVIVPADEDEANSEQSSSEEEEAEEEGSSLATGTGRDGSDAEAEPDIHIVGEGVLKSHASVTNTGGRCILRSKGKAADLTHVNGVSVAVLLKQKQVEVTAEGSDGFLGDRDGAAEDPADGIVLTHSDRVAFCQCLFVFIDPAKGMAEVLITSGQVSYFLARKELNKNQWKSAGLKFMKGMQMTKAFGAKELVPTLLRRMSTAVESSLGASVASGQRPSTMDDQGSTDTLRKGGATENAAEQLRARDRMLEAKDREIAELRRQLAHTESQLAEARAAARREAGSVEPAPLKSPRGPATGRSEGLQLGMDSVDAKGGLVNLGSFAGKTAGDMRAEIVSTFESAISAIEEVEALFAVRQTARRLPAP